MDSQEYPSTFKAPSQRPSTRLSEVQVVSMLNHLLESLHLPIIIVSPTDLTPSLLFAILEVLLGQKLPVPSGSNHHGDIKVQKVKLFLGVLETDILQQDIGLSRVDPRRLAAGQCEETLFIAKVLCLVGRQLGLLAPTYQGQVPSKERSNSGADSSFNKAARKPMLSGFTSKRDPPNSRPASDTSAQSSKPKRSTKTRSPTHPPSRFSTPELDTTCVFYAPPSCTTNRDTQTTSVTSIFGHEDDERSFTPDSAFTTPDSSDAGILPSPKGRYRGRSYPLVPDDSASAEDPVPTPSSVALSLEEPFQSPRAPSCTRNIHQSHDPTSPSLLMSVDDIRPPQFTPMQAQPSSSAGPRLAKRPRLAAPTSQSACSSPVASKERDFAVRRGSSRPPNTKVPTASHNSRDSGSGSQDMSLDSDLCRPHSPRQAPVSVRHEGYIELVDEDREIASYEQSRSLVMYSSSPGANSSVLGDGRDSPATDRSILRFMDDRMSSEEDRPPPKQHLPVRSRGAHGTIVHRAPRMSRRSIANIHEEYERTLKLLDERTRLLKELADLKVA